MSTLLDRQTQEIHAVFTMQLNHLEADFRTKMRRQREARRRDAREICWRVDDLTIRVDMLQTRQAGGMRISEESTVQTAAPCASLCRPRRDCQVAVQVRARAQGPGCSLLASRRWRSWPRVASESDEGGPLPQEPRSSTLGPLTPRPAPPPPPEQQSNHNTDDLECGG